MRAPMSTTSTTPARPPAISRPHTTSRPRVARRPRVALASLACLAGALSCALAAGCATVHPAPITAGSLAEAQTFPYFRVYWAGSRFGSYRLVAADGRKNYSTAVGDSVYYGDCVAGKSSALGESGCELPLQITTAIYVMGSNMSLGAHRDTLLRGVPAVIYDSGRSILLYSGRLTIHVSSDTFAEALGAVRRLQPLNAPGSATRPLPKPVYCPLLSGPQPQRLQRAMRHLPHHACQRAAAAVQAQVALFGKS
jgi:hypothetical protein